MNISDEVRDALTFDPFAELANDGGQQQDNNQQQNNNGGQQDQTQQPQGNQVPQSNQNSQQQRQAPQQVPQSNQNGGQPPVDQKTLNTVEQFMRGIQQPGQQPQPHQMPPQQQFQQPVPQQQYQPPAPQQQTPQGQGRTFDYSRPPATSPVEIPPAILQQVFNENPQVAAQGLNTLVSTLWNSMLQEIHAHGANLSQQMQQMPQRAVQDFQVVSAQQQLREKFYSAHSDLSDPIGQNAVGSIANMVGQQYARMGQHFDPTSKDFIDYVATQARLMLGRQAPQQQQQQAPRRQFQTSGPARAGTGGGGPFAEAIGGFF